MVDKPGHDPATGFLYLPSATFDPVPERPTHADAVRALSALADVFCDFLFTSEPARYVPIAAALSILARPAIVGAVPAFCFDAPTPGTGKSLCADAVCMLATGRSAPRGTFPADDAELEKVLAGYAMRGSAVIGFDNVASKFGGASLDKCIAAPDTVDLRVLGSIEIKSLVWRAVVLASGNNLPIQGDTQRRVLMCRIESPLERPEERTGFRHGEGAGFLRWISDNRARLVSDALTVLRAFVVAGCPAQEAKPLGTFEGWSRLVAHAIAWAGGANVLAARVSEESGDDGERATFAAFLRYFPSLYGTEAGLTCREAIQLLYPREREPGPPDGHDDLRDSVETLCRTPSGRIPDANKLGLILRSYRRRLIGGRMVIGEKDRRGAMKWRVIQADNSGG
jgi:hypothetical protein